MQEEIIVSMKIKYNILDESVAVMSQKDSSQIRC